MYINVLEVHVYNLIFNMLDPNYLEKNMAELCRLAY